MTDLCPGSVMGLHGDPDRHGICPWCSRKVTSALPKPALGRGYIYDPDYGSARDGRSL